MRQNGHDELDYPVPGESSMARADPRCAGDAGFVPPVVPPAGGTDPPACRESTMTCRASRNALQWSLLPEGYPWHCLLSG